MRAHNASFYKDVPFRSLNDVLNSWGQNPKTEVFGVVHEQDFQALETKTNPYNLITAKPVMTKFLQKVPIMNNWPLCAVPWLIKKSKMAHSGHLEFNKMLISLYQIKLFEPNLVQSSSTRLQTFKNVPNSLNMKTQDGSHCYLGKM